MACYPFFFPQLPCIYSPGLPVQRWFHSCVLSLLSPFVKQQKPHRHAHRPKFLNGSFLFLGMENWQLKLVIKHADHRMRQVSNSINGQDKKKSHPGNIIMLMKLAMLNKIYNLLQRGNDDKLLEYMALKMRGVGTGLLLYAVDPSSVGRLWCWKQSGWPNEKK